MLSLMIMAMYSLFCYEVYQTYALPLATSTNTTNLTYDNNIEADTLLGILEIEKIDLKRPIYPTTSVNNTVDKNVMILEPSTMPDQENSRIILAAHSGPGAIAFFDRLDELTYHDIVTFTYENQIYTYEVIGIEQQEKDGTITIPKNSYQSLILTTCSKQDATKQLIVTCKIKS